MESECTQCDAGFYCDALNMVTVSGPCDAGYYCQFGSDMAAPESGNKGTAGPCPKGKYCPAQTSVPIDCPIGTYNNDTHLTQESECLDCAYGRYCASPGLEEPTGECDAGFYCLRGASSPNNPTADSTSGPCTIGHYCPQGTSHPLACPCGSYNPNTGESSCFTCPAGFYCPEGSTTYVSFSCPVGHYCPEGTCAGTDNPCPAGYYQPDTEKDGFEDCIPCTPGKYCGTSGRSAVSGDCSPGWFCSRGASLAEPVEIGIGTDQCFCNTSYTTGGKCSPGEFCPGGSSVPTPCTAGKCKLKQG